jgi:DNA-binding transcriptional LysR family regulator
MHSIRQFELVKALATYRHFGRAAAALGVSQPALTRSLKHLEEGLGVPLFDRQGVTPTVFGELMLSHGEAVIKGFADLVREINLAKGLEIGEFSVSAGPYPAEISGQRAIGMLSAQHPRLFVELKLFNWTKIVNQVLNERIDLGFADLRGGRKSGIGNRGCPVLPVEFLLCRQAPVSWAQQRDARGPMRVSLGGSDTHRPDATISSSGRFALRRV